MTVLYDDDDLLNVLEAVGGETFVLPGGKEVTGRWGSESLETLETRTRRPGATFRRCDVLHLDAGDVLVRSSSNVRYTLRDREPDGVDAFEYLVLEVR